MRGHMRALCIAGLLSLASIRAIGAQAPPVIAPATRIRFALAPGDRMRIAQVIVQRNDSLWVRTASTDDTLALALATLGRLDVSRGQHRSTLKGAGLGLVSGAVAGAIIGYSAGEDCSKSSFICFPRDQTTLMGAVYVGGLGAGVGALLGHFHVQDRWVSVRSPGRVKIAVFPANRGFRVAFTRCASRCTNTRPASDRGQDRSTSTNR